jgi:Rps23 Pro-64 3,4-dihydroxylase Tpa1-like proline 4-hydroxylase
MEPESLLDVTYTLNPNLLTSIKSVDSVAVFGAGAPMELSLALFQVLMAFAGKTTVRQAFHNLDVDVDLERFAAIIHEFFERGLLVRDAPVEDGHGLREFLGERLLGNPAVADRFTRSMQRGRAVVIPDALPIDLAERVHQELDRSGHWTVGEGGHDFSHYRNSFIDHLEARGGALAECSRLFTSAATRRFIAELSGQDCAGEAHAAAAWYRPGEYALPHDDSSVSSSRSVAYIWYLTKGWRQEWGGSLFWCPTGQYIGPRFNVLVIFHVTPSSLHSVCPVAPGAVAKRLTINGFWHSAAQRPLPAPVAPDAWISRAVYGTQPEDAPDLLPIVVV